MQEARLARYGEGSLDCAFWNTGFLRLNEPQKLDRLPSPLDLLWLNGRDLRDLL
jgi:hypothetical protein